MEKTTTMKANETEEALPADTQQMQSDVAELRRMLMRCFDLVGRCQRLRHLLYANNERLRASAAVDDESAAYREHLLKALVSEGGSVACRAELAAKRMELQRQMLSLKQHATAKPAAYAWLKRFLQWSPISLHLLTEIVEEGVSAEERG